MPLQAGYFTNPIPAIAGNPSEIGRSPQNIGWQQVRQPTQMRNFSRWDDPELPDKSYKIQAHTQRLLRQRNTVQAAKAD